MTHRILVVDDDSLIRRSYCREVARHIGVAPLMASRAEEARCLIEREPNARWIVVLDNEMPPCRGDLVKSGLELARYLQIETTIQAKIIMIGSSVTPEVAIAGEMVSLRKPFEVHELVSQIRLLLDASR